MVLTTFLCRFLLDLGVFHIIPDIFKAKFNEACPSWKKASTELHNRWFGEFKVINILVQFKMFLLYYF